MDAILRVSGPGLDVENCKAWLPAHLIQRAWKPDGPRTSGPPDGKGGFNAALTAVTDGSEQSPVALLSTLSSHVAALVTAGACAEIDIALEVQRGAPTSVHLTAAFLNAVLSCNTTLCVTGYPCSDDD